VRCCEVALLPVVYHKCRRNVNPRPKSGVAGHCGQRTCDYFSGPRIARIRPPLVGCTCGSVARNSFRTKGLRGELFSRLDGFAPQSDRRKDLGILVRPAFRRCRATKDFPEAPVHP